MALQTVTMVILNLPKILLPVTLMTTVIKKIPQARTDTEVFVIVAPVSCVAVVILKAMVEFPQGRRLYISTEVSEGYDLIDPDFELWLQENHPGAVPADRYIPTFRIQVLLNTLSQPF